MFLKNRNLQTALLSAAILAVTALVPSNVHSEEAERKPLRPAIQEDDKDTERGLKEFHPGSGALRFYSGYTRPGQPEDRLSKDGSVREASIEPDDDDAHGATVYFAVYENQGAKAKDNDTFGTGIKNFDNLFKKGMSDEGSTSPTLDTKAKYIYLYQVVNDRGTAGIITRASIRLITDQRAISSWGHLTSRTFAFKEGDWAVQTKVGKIRAAALDTDDNKVRPAALDENERKSTLGPSYRICPASLSAPENRLYRDFAPALVDREPTLLSEKITRRQFDQTTNKLGQDALKMVTDPVHEPDQVVFERYAMRNVGKLYEADDRRRDVEGIRDEKIEKTRDSRVRYSNLKYNDEYPFVRAYFYGNNALRRFERSNVFGFTSEYPPIMDFGSLRLVKAERKKDIKDPKDVKEPKNVKDPVDPKDPKDPIPKVDPAAFGDPETDLVDARNPNTVSELPTPFPPGGIRPAAFNPTGPASPGGAGAGTGGVGGPLGGGFGGGTTGGGGTAGVPAGFGSAPGTGGGSGGGFGGGSGGGNGQPNNGQNQTGTGTDPLQSINLNVQQSVTQTQNNRQSQRQSQRQGQHQHQNQSGGGNSQVVPEPTTIVLSAMGLTTLVFFRRRKAKPEAAI